MTVVVVTPPTPVVDIDLARAHLRVDDTSSDGLISAYIAAATAVLDAPTGWLGRALGQQTLELRLDRFHICHTCRSRYLAGGFGSGFVDVPAQTICRGHADQIDLPFAPVSEIVSVKYTDTAGAEQTVDAGAYQLIGGPRLAPAYGLTWPAIRIEPEAVSIRYTAGYTTIPAPIQAAILLMVGDLYANREAVMNDPRIAQIINPTVEALLTPFRIWVP